jgi:hypothetical protein
MIDCQSNQPVMRVAVVPAALNVLYAARETRATGAPGTLHSVGAEEPWAISSNEIVSIAIITQVLRQTQLQLL